MNVAKKNGIVKSISLSRHSIYIDGNFWSQSSDETKQLITHCFAEYMKEKTKNGSIEIKDYKSKTTYAKGNTLKVKIYKQS